MQGITPELNQLAEIVRRMIREIESHRESDDFFQRMAAFRFEANDAICVLYTYAMAHADCFTSVVHQYRFCRSIDEVQAEFSRHQSYWTRDAILRDSEDYAIASGKAAKRLSDWIDQMRSELNSEQLAS